MSRAKLAKYMPSVAEYRERLATLQGAWDSLALLSHLAGDGTDLGSTRQAFEALSGDLVTHLAEETCKKTLLAAKARAQVTIDTLARSLFERTADVSVLIADEPLRECLRQCAAGQLLAARPAAQRRLAQFAAKYTVYRNVLLLSRQGELIAQLERGRAPERSADPLIARTFAAADVYTESFGANELAPEARRVLTYSRPILVDGQALGMLCLTFGLEEECERLFARLQEGAEWMVLAVLDDAGEVIASSDAYQLPAGARVPIAAAETGGIVRFAGREFLAVSRRARAYQGYTGPRWYGQVMVPLERAFEALDLGAATRVSADVLADLRRSGGTFSPELRRIPLEADAVQRDLNRSVWNGSVRLARQASSASEFAKALLREISNMGRRTQDVFERSIGELHETVVSTILQDARFIAALSVDLLSRNLYERANDCRWWALDARLIACLAAPATGPAGQAAQELRGLHEHYPMYHALVLFDARGTVTAVSRADQEGFVGRVIAEPWVSAILETSGVDGYSVSCGVPSAFYGDAAALVYGAPVRAASGQIVGGLAALFDTRSQLEAMLRDVLPRDERGELVAGCCAAFLDQERRVIATSCEDAPALAAALATLGTGNGTDSASIVRADDHYYALALQTESGYREHRGIGTHALALIPLGEAPRAPAARRPGAAQRGGTRTESGRGDGMEFATFSVGDNWYALPAACVVEAIDTKLLQRLPGVEPWCAGVLMFDNQAIVVGDLARLLGVEPLETARTAVVLRVPPAPRPFALLVEALGDIPEVSFERLLSIDTCRTSEDGLVAHAIQPLEAHDPLVLALNADRLVTVLHQESSQSLAPPVPPLMDLGRPRARRGV